MAYLSLSGIRKEFGEHVAVQRFDLDVGEGEFVSFLGPSGCGKTTTLRMIAGFELPTAGTIMIAGEDVSRTPPNKRNVGMVFQSYALFPNMTVASNIAFGLRMRKESKSAIKARVAELLELIHLPQAADKYPYELSGGMQQRVALARALAFRPRVLLLDEPLSALDAKIRVSLRQEIRAIQRQLGITTVYVTHDQEEALSLSDRVVVMSQGRMEQVGTPSQIYNTPATEFVARFVGTLNILPGRVVDAASGRVNVAGQELRVGNPVTAGNGAQVSVALRPEAIGLETTAAPDGNRLSGRVSDVTFLGSIVRIRVRLEDGSGPVAFDTFNNPHAVPPAIDERVTLAFPPEALLVLQESATPGHTLVDADGLPAT
jgi:putative spermidine/putrescine transport system ATP-binding protein